MFITSFFPQHVLGCFAGQTTTANTFFGFSTETGGVEYPTKTQQSHPLKYKKHPLNSPQNEQIPYIHHYLREGV
jgi:hypothetical protein